MIIVTCMGRLAHLKRTLPHIIEHDEVLVCCWGDHEAAKWVRGLDHPRARTIEVQEKKVFHKSRALNVAANAAIRGGETKLLFLDADTMIVDHAAFGAWYSEASKDLEDFNVFHVCLRPPGHLSSWDLTGVLMVSAQNFLRSGGYDEKIHGWGCEDLVMRLSLAINLGMSWKDIPLGIFKPIPHADELRTINYAEKNKAKSNARNARHLFDTVARWTGKPMRENDGKYRPLLSIPERAK
jgi:hypothetical protein